jgi:hypothetical protein
MSDRTRTLIDRRTVYGIGNGEAFIYGLADGEFEIEVVSENGTAAVQVSDEVDAWHAWMHPFDRESRLTIPEKVEAAAPTAEYHAMYAALELAEAGDSDEV